MIVDRGIDDSLNRASSSQSSQLTTPMHERTHARTNTHMQARTHTSTHPKPPHTHIHRHRHTQTHDTMTPQHHDTTTLPQPPTPPNKRDPKIKRCAAQLASHTNPGSLLRKRDPKVKRCAAQPGGLCYASASHTPTPGLCYASAPRRSNAPCAAQPGTDTDTDH
jgi:hypothetical protein